MSKLLFFTANFELLFRVLCPGLGKLFVALIQAAIEYILLAKEIESCMRRINKKLVLSFVYRNKMTDMYKCNTLLVI